MRTSLYTAAALVAALAVSGSAQVTFNNTATGGPASATTTGTLQAYDSTNAKVGASSCVRTAVSGASVLPIGVAPNPTNNGAGGASATTGFTIQWWYRVPNATAQTAFGYLWGELGWNSFRCFQNGAAGVGNIIVRGALTDLPTTGAPLQNAGDPNGWIHFALVVDTQANMSTWYVNGAVNNTGPTGTITGMGTNLNIFGYNGSNTGYVGNHDDVRIYDWARTAADIAADFNVRATGTGPSGSPNVPDLGYYECEQTSAVLSGAGTGTIGTTVNLGLAAPNSIALPYQMASSFGTGPTPIDTRSLGLTLDALFSVTASGVLPGVFVGYVGVIGASGNAAGSIVIPSIPAIIGIDIHTAFATIDGASPSSVRDISNTYSFKIN